eukprot:5705069-Amphidinium_carterae.1
MQLNLHVLVRAFGGGELSPCRRSCSAGACGSPGTNRDKRAPLQQALVWWRRDLQPSWVVLGELMLATVGKNGTFPHGIEVVTLADFWTLSMRRHAFLEARTAHISVRVFPARNEHLLLSMVSGVPKDARSLGQGSDPVQSNKLERSFAR